MVGIIVVIIVDDMIMMIINVSDATYLRLLYRGYS